MIYQFKYRMELAFSSPVTDHHFTLRPVPKTDDCQQIRHLDIQVTPDTPLSFGKDAFSNRTVYGHIEHAHNGFIVQVTGEASLTDGVQLRRVMHPERLFMCRSASPLTRPGPVLSETFLALKPDLPQRDYDAACRIMETVHDRMTYMPGATTTQTDAETALALGQGVCQDYAHVMLALCRMAHIPCRYVAGMVEGIGETHAWVEVEEAGTWHALDPTYGIEAGSDHIKLLQGRDFTDCRINKGIFRGACTQTQTILVEVSPVEK